jgi:Rap1a immunity proteins
MRLRALLLTVALLWPVTVFSETKDIPVGAFVNGNELFGVCSDDHHFNQAYCKGYVVGVADAISVVTAQIANVGSIAPTCLPKEHLAPEQVRDVVVQYLTAHPETRHEVAAAEAVKALLAAFPCK